MTLHFVVNRQILSKIMGARNALMDWVRQQQGILLAVILQDMKTRFGGSYISYLIAIAWPFAHVAMIVVGYLIINKYAPIGDDPVIFVLTACVPYMLCLYPSRLIGAGILVNRPFLCYTPVTTYHLVFARMALEFLNVAIVVIIIISICIFLDRDVMPISLPVAAGSLAASVFLGSSMGFFFAVMSAVMGSFFYLFSTLLMVALYIGSLALVPEYMIGSVTHEYLLYNPVYCLIKWLRSAYYPSYEMEDIPKVYVLTLSIITFSSGLLVERFLRGRVIAS